MKTQIITIVLLTFCISCQKDKIKTSISLQSSDKIELMNDSIFIGSHCGGGIIFWIDSTGQHGLIAALQDQTLGISWSDGTYAEVGGTSKQIGKGFSNTKRIISTLGKGTYAALLSATYSVECYTDWYLPSQKELKLLYHNRKILGATAINYWSSSEYNSALAYSCSFITGVTAVEDKNIASDAVRSIRRF
jgi:hypothetical protein